MMAMMRLFGVVGSCRVGSGSCRMHVGATSACSGRSTGYVGLRQFGVCHVSDGAEQWRGWVGVVDIIRVYFRGVLGVTRCCVAVGARMMLVVLEF